MNSPRPTQANSVSRTSFSSIPIWPSLCSVVVQIVGIRHQELLRVRFTCNNKLTMVTHEYKYLEEIAARGEIHSSVLQSKRMFLTQCIISARAANDDG